MTKLKTIKLTTGHAPAHFDHSRTQEQFDLACRFQVEQVTDSIEYLPGQYLERLEVQKLCGTDDWKVTIVQRSNTKR